MLNPAYWLNPEGVPKVVTHNHISAIIKYPEEYGFELDYIKSVYKKHNEKLYTEGSARVELILEALERGFIRIRFYKNYWAVSVNNVSKSVDGLLAWLNLIDGKAFGNWHEIRLNISSKNGKSISVRRLEEGELKIFSNSKSFKEYLESL